MSHLEDVVAQLRAGQRVRVTLDLQAGRTLILPTALLVAEGFSSLALEGYGGTTPFVRYADGVVPPYLLDVEVLSR